MLEQVAALQRAADARERMGGRDAEGELEAADLRGLVAAAGRAFAGGDDDVGAALAQRLPGAGEGLAADAQPVPQRRSSKARTSPISAWVGISESCTSRSSDSKPVAIWRMRDSRSLAALSSQRPSLSISSPAAVRVTRGPLRSNSSMPSCSSSLPTAYEMVEGTLFRRVAAAAKDPWRAMASTTSMASRLSLSTGVFLWMSTKVE